jgi:hypothetical protein
MGMGDPPIGPGFNEEVALSQRGNCAGLDPGGGSQKAKSVIAGSGHECSQSCQACSNVPSASDVLPSQIPKVNMTTGWTANASHR